MKKLTTLCLAMSVTFGFAQVNLVDFETPVTFEDFSGGVATQIANPQLGGINTSATVG